MNKMSINRYNYLELFLLYTDNELKADERKAVEDFIQQNPDLKEELLMLQGAILKPDTEVIFDSKESLLQFDNIENFIYPGNFEEFAVAYADNELTETQKDSLESFIHNNPDFQQEFDLIRSLKLPADDAVMFPDKALLYRTEKDRVIFSWWRMAAAAIVIIFAGLLWLNKRPASSVSPGLVSTPHKVKELIAGQVEESTIKEGKSISANDSVKTESKTAKTGVAYKSPKLAVKMTTATVHSNNKGLPDQVAIREHMAVVNQKKLSTPAMPGNKTQAEPGNKPESLATIEASIENNNKKILEQPAIKINPPNQTDYTAVKTVANSQSDENVFLANIPVEKKSPLRGILRKASRFIDKNTPLKNSKKPGILIGNIEIAFQ